MSGAAHRRRSPCPGALSATMQSAELAAKSVAAEGIDVPVVDSRTVSLGLGTIALACAELPRPLPATPTTPSSPPPPTSSAARGSSVPSTRWTT